MNICMIEKNRKLSCVDKSDIAFNVFVLFLNVNEGRRDVVPIF
jgi:hypothetical protein